MNSLDLKLEQVIRDWMDAEVQEAARLNTIGETKVAPTIFQVVPQKSGAAGLSLWVSGDGAHVGFSVGTGSWWPDEVAFEPASIRQLLSAVAAGKVNEQVRRLFGRTVARRGRIDLSPGKLLRYSQLNPFSILPVASWQVLNYEPYR